MAEPLFQISNKVQTEVRPETLGNEMCDRDFLVKTSILDPKASLNVAGSDADGDVTYTAKTRGAYGNLISVEHQDSGSGGLTVSVTDLDIVIDFGGAAPTGTQVKDAVNGDASASALVAATTPGTGASASSIAAPANLSGGATNSAEDLKLNPATNKEEPWHEFHLVGVYKDDGGTMVEVTDQTDADANAILSVWEYRAVRQDDHITQVAFEVRDGNVLVDPTIPDVEDHDHRAYAIGAPDIPGNLGGQIAFFDGYLGPLKGKKLEATSPTAKALDPANGAGTNIMRFYFVHPAGSKMKHVVRLVTYRPSGSF
ncbi:MAG: hypothetical protein R3324_10685 [Halobacteriales archaeon]|nr:hypothetical protein [Halobacteriales archaeon]